MSAKQRARRGMKSLSLHEVDREKFQLFTKRRQGWVNVLRTLKKQMEAQGMCWRAIVEDV